MAEAEGRETAESAAFRKLSYNHYRMSRAPRKSVTSSKTFIFSWTDWGISDE